MTAIEASDFLVIPTLIKSKGTNSPDITLGTIDEMVEMDAFQGTVLGIAPFQDRWVGDNQTKSSRKFFETLPVIAPEIPKLIDEGKSLASLPPPVTSKGVVKYHPVYLFEAIFAEIESQWQSQKKPLPTPQTAS